MTTPHKIKLIKVVLSKLQFDTIVNRDLEVLLKEEELKLRIINQNRRK